MKSMFKAVVNISSSHCSRQIRWHQSSSRICCASENIDVMQWINKPNDMKDIYH